MAVNPRQVRPPEERHRLPRAGSRARVSVQSQALPRPAALSMVADSLRSASSGRGRTPRRRLRVSSTRPCCPGSGFRTYSMSVIFAPDWLRGKAKVNQETIQRVSVPVQEFPAASGPWWGGPGAGPDRRLLAAWGHLMVPCTFTLLSAPGGE